MALKVLLKRSYSFDGVSGFVLFATNFTNWTGFLAIIVSCVSMWQFCESLAVIGIEIVACLVRIFSDKPF